jgi:hypothetical protein
VLLVIAPSDQARPPDTASGPIASLLALVPATPASRVETVVNDYALATARAGLVRPPANDVRLAESYRLAMTTDAGAGVGCFPSPLATDASTLVGLDTDAFTSSFAIARRDTQILGGPASAPGRSLLSARDVRPLADALDGFSVHAAVFSTDVFRFQEPSPSPEDAAPDALLPYRSVALGVGHDGDGAFMAIALLMPDDASARVNASRLATIASSGLDANDRRPWSDLVSVRESRTSGAVAVVVLRTRVPLLWIAVERRPDTLLWWRAP